MTVEAAVTAASWRGTDVDVTSVEGELARLWRNLTGRLQQPNAVRTSVYNLVVYADDDDHARSIVDQLSTLSQRRPSRAVILVSDRFGTRSSVDVAVTVQCHVGSGDRALCHEQLVVTAHGRAADHLASVTTPLLMPELPVYLWWPGQPLFGHRVFHRLLSVADQCVVDSGEFFSPGDGLANVARLVSGGQVVHDLNWLRLSPWRDIIAQFFDPPAYLPYVHGMRSVHIEFGAGQADLRRASAGVLLLLGWAGELLGWEPETTLDSIIDRDVELSVVHGDRLIPVTIQYRERGSALAGMLCTIELVCQPSGLPPARFTVERFDDLVHARVSSEVHEQGGVDRVVPIGGRSDGELLGDNLETAGQDALYARAVAMASRMAGREVWIPA